MNQFVKNVLKRMIFIVPVILISMSISAQESDSYDKAMKEIKEHFGTVPQMFQLFPEHAVAGAWESFKQLNGPESKIPAKYRELIQLAVASQIPCDYCIYFHTAAAMASGATKEEIREAIAHGAQTRHWSMIMQGNQVEFEAFKKEFDKIMEDMAKEKKD